MWNIWKTFWRTTRGHTSNRDRVRQPGPTSPLQTLSDRQSALKPPMETIQCWRCENTCEIEVVSLWRSSWRRRGVVVSDAEIKNTNLRVGPRLMLADSPFSGNSQEPTVDEVHCSVTVRFCRGTLTQRRPKTCYAKRLPSEFMWRSGTGFWKLNCTRSAGRLMRVYVNEWTPLPTMVPRSLFSF